MRPVDVPWCVKARPNGSIQCLRPELPHVVDGKHRPADASSRLMACHMLRGRRRKFSPWGKPCDLSSRVGRYNPLQTGSRRRTAEGESFVNA